MTIYFQGAEKDEFGIYNVASWLDTSASNYNASNSRIALRMRGTGGSAANGYEATYNATATNHWVHCYARHDRGGFHTTVNNLISIFDQAGVERIGLFTDMSNTTYMRTWSGSWTQRTTTFTTSLNGVTQPFDIYVKLGGTGVGEIRLYINGAPAGSTLFDTTFGGAVTGFSKARFNSCGGDSSDISYLSEVIVADWNTIGSKLVTAYPSAAGTYNEWTGAGYTAIDEALTAGDIVTSGTADQRISADVSTVPALASGEVIAGVKLAAWASKDLGGPQNMNFFSRISGTDYNGSDKALQTVIGSVVEYMETSPATATAWTLSEVNAAEFGVRSRT